MLLYLCLDAEATRELSHAAAKHEVMFKSFLGVCLLWAYSVVIIQFAVFASLSSPCCSCSCSRDLMCCRTHQSDHFPLMYWVAGNGVILYLAYTCPLIDYFFPSSVLCQQKYLNFCSLVIFAESTMTQMIFLFLLFILMLQVSNLHLDVPWGDEYWREAYY